MSALTDDPNPLHFDHGHVADSGHDGLVNQGWVNLSFLTQVVTDLLDTPADLRSVDVRFHRPVYAGGVVRASGTVTAVERSGDDGRAEIEVEVTLRRPDESVAASGTVTASTEP